MELIDESGGKRCGTLLFEHNMVNCLYPWCVGDLE